MSGRSSFVSAIRASVDAALAPGEHRRALALLRGSEGGDRVAVVTDRRVLLFTVSPAARAAVLDESFPAGAVRVLDATLRGPGAVVVLRFPDARLGWFTPVPAWSEATLRLLDELGPAVDEPYPAGDDGCRPDRAPSD